MCILFLSYSPDGGDYLLIAANNRDEFYHRPTAQASFWSDHSKVVAGRDLQAANGGTWFGVTRDGQFSVLTNFRQPPQDIDKNAKSRGHLVSDYLTGGMAPLDYCKLIDGRKYNGFSIITADLRGEGGVAYTSNKDPSGPQVVGSGVTGLSNATLNEPWQKVVRGKETFTEIVKTPDSNLTDRLFELLSDDTIYWPDAAISDLYSGVNSSLEVSRNIDECKKKTSAIFVKPCIMPSGMYGTRTQTVLTITHNGVATYTEKTNVTAAAYKEREGCFADPTEWNTVSHSFQI